MNIFCTLFDKNYLDRGLLTIKSLNKVCPSAYTYILAMDDITYDILQKIGLQRATPVKLSELLTDRLQALKESRSRAEFCWTCTALLIKYVIENYNEKECTYIDADLYFFNDPKCLIDEMYAKNKCVQIIPHWFTSSAYDKAKEQHSGKFCVEFNTFTNDAKSQELLERWIENCLNDCSYENCGDQRYLIEWEKLDFVNVISNMGAGIAPWNINRYKLLSEWKVYEKYTKKTFDFIFYHFQNITYKERLLVKTDVYIQHKHVDKALFESIYPKYLLELEDIKKELEVKYGLVPLVLEYITSEKFKNRKNDSFLTRLFKQPLSLSIHQIGEKIRRNTRKKDCYIDLRRYKNDSMQ